MSFAAVSVVPPRNPRLKFSLFVLAFVALLLPAAARAQSTFTGGAITFTASDSSAQSSTATVTGATGTVKTVAVELDGVKTDGVCNAQGTICGYSMQEAEFLLKGPQGEQFVLLSSTGDGTDGCDNPNDQTNLCNGLQGTTPGNPHPDTITITDTATSAAPYIGGWDTSSMPYTVKPSSYNYNNSSNPPPLPGGDQSGDFPQTDGCANPTSNPPLLCTAQTLSGAFATTAAGGTWTLYLLDYDSPVDPISITGWKLTLTYNTGAGPAATSTAITPSSNPATYANSSSTASVTFTATVSTTSSGAPTGTVAFSANGTTITGCGSKTLASAGSNSSSASCAASLGQGYNNISAVYTSNNSGSFGQSNTSMKELVEVVPSNPTGNQWCNNSLITDPIGGAAGVAYPSVIQINDPAYDSKSVANVVVNLEGVAGSVNGIGGEFMLVAPGGGTHNLDFFDSGFGFPGVVNAVNLTFEDLPTPNYVSGSTTQGQQPTIDNPYSATNDNANTNPDTFPTSTTPPIDTTIPAVPGTINFAPPYGTGNHEYTHTNILTFGEAFNGVPANGSWSLYTVSDEPLTVNSGWCITLTLNTGNATVTALAPSSNPATAGSPVTFTATVTSGGSAVTSGGTVTFLDNDAVPAGTTGGNNVVTLPSSGIATFTTSLLSEGDHTITASYSGTASDNSSFSSVLNQRINHATTVTNVSPTQWQYCNPGTVEIQQGTASGPLTPNPSNIFVTNLPGSFDSVGVQLTGFSVLTADDLDALATLVEGPTGAALDFFSNTTQGNTSGTGEATLGNYIFDDGASARVTNLLQNIGPNAYLPTAYESFLHAPDVFTSSASGFYPAPSSFSYAPTNSFGTSQTFADVFPSGIEANGTWSLFFSSGFANKTFGAANGWCVNLTVTPPVLATPGLSHVGNFAQGESNAQYTVDVTNNGPGSTGDPTGGSNPMTVTDALPTGLTYSGFSGSNWSCSASGQNVTCTDDVPVVADTAYPVLTIDVNISGTLTGTVANQITAGGAGTANKTSNSDSATVEVAPVFTSVNNTSLTVGSSSPFTFIATGNPAPTLSESGNLPSGIIFTPKSGGSATLTGTPAAGTGGVYDITVAAANGTTDANQSFTLTVNQAPAISSAASTTFTAGSLGSFTVTAASGTHPTATFSETGALPSGVTLSTAGVLSGTPAAGTGGVYNFTIQASNGVGSPATQSFALTVDQASAITSANSTTFTVGTPGSFTVTSASSTFPNTTTYSETGALPSGVTLTAAGVLSGMPAAGSSTSYAITITASNGVGTPASQSFTLTVNQAPAFTGGNSDSMNVNTPNIFLIFTSGNPTAAISLFNNPASLPTGVSFTDNGNGHGTLSGTPGTGTGGSYPLVFTAINGVLPNATLNFTLTIKQPVAFTSAASTTLTTGAAGSFNVTTTGYPAPSFSESGALPTGVTFTDNGNGTASLAGMPAAGTGGSYSITIQASNGFSTPSQSFALVVDQAPVVTSANNTTFIVGSPGSFTMTSAAGTYPIPTFSETGALPTGVTLSTGGVLSGTPAAGTSGSYPITVTASNGVAPNSTQGFTLTVNLPQFQLTTAATPAAGGSVTPASGGSYIQGTSVPITATPAAGYVFVGWSSAADPVASSTLASTTIPINGPESVTAQFAPILVVTTNQDDPGTATNCTPQTTPGTGTDSSCSLRDALLNAAGAGAGNISFSSSAFNSGNSTATNTIVLTNGTLTLPANTAVTGATSGSGSSLTNLATVSGNAASTVFTIQSGVTGASLSGLTITNGSASSGGGINNGGTLAVTSSTISGNTASASGGGIYNSGSLTLTASTIAGNSVPGTCILSASGGGIWNSGSLIASLSTFTANTAIGCANGVGGAISSLAGTMSVSSSTITGNSADGGGGGIFFSGANGTPNQLGYNILSGNSSSSGPDVYGPYTEEGGDLIGASNINLAPLGNYGGPTQTMIPLTPSPAICGTQQGDGTIVPNLTIDQRGLPLDSNCAAGFVDSGAVQTNYALTFTTEPPSSDFAGVPLSPAPVVTLTENGLLFTPATSTVNMTDGDGALTGTDSVGLSSGTAAFSNLTFSSAVGNDGLVAAILLNSSQTILAGSSLISINAGYQLTTAVSPVGGGTVTPASGGYYPPGATVPLVATPAAGYTFVNWTSAADPVASSTSASTTIPMNSAESVTANFTANLVVTTYADLTNNAGDCTAQVNPATGTDTACSLRDALAFAVATGSGNITFDSTLFGSPQTILLGSYGSLNIPSNTYVTGPTTGSGYTLANLVTVNGNNASTVFTAASTVTGASLSGLIITNGNSSYGGGISNSGALGVIGSTISGNTSTLGGGGVYNTGTITLYGDTFSGNSATNTGSGGASGGGILNTGGLAILDSTLNANTALSGGNGVGGAIYSTSGSLVVVASDTISGNSSDGSAGGVYFNGIDGTLNLLGYNILSANAAPLLPNVGGLYTEGGGDLIDVSNIGLGPLGNYGGPTQTMIPLPGSPAICAIQTGSTTLVPGLPEDQRGFNFVSTYCPSGSVDSGAVQTNYALAFTQNFLSSYSVGVPMSPSIPVALTESGVAATAATNSVTMADGEAVLTGSTSVALSSGLANFANLIIPEAESTDTLTATLSLNPALTPPLNLNTLSSPPFQVATGTAVLTYPTAGSTLGTSQTFNWTTGAGVTAYWFNLGYGPSGAEAKEVYNSGPINTTTVTVNGIGANGVTVYATLYSLIDSVWLAQSYTFTESGSPVPAALTAPTTGSILTGTSANFTWNTGAGVTAYWLNVGTGTTAAAMQNVYSSGQTLATTASVTGIPALAQPFYATLYSLINGVWQPTSYTFTESGTPVAATLTLPTSGTQLNGSATFTWSPGQLITYYWLTVGDGPGNAAAKDLYSSGPTTSTTASVSGLPTFGGTLYVTLYSYIYGTWQPTVYTFLETGTAQPATLTFPGSGATLDPTSQTFNWTAGSGVTSYWLDLGYGTNGVSAKNIYSSGAINATTATVTGLPAFGVPIYATLYSYINGVWEPMVYTFNSSGSPVAATMISPTSPSTLPSGSETFTWTTGGGVTAYWLNLGTSPTGANSKNIYDSESMANTSATVTGLPSNGETIYATLYSLINGVWQSVQYTYTAF